MCLLYMKHNYSNYFAACQALKEAVSLCVFYHFDASHFNGSLTRFAGFGQQGIAGFSHSSDYYLVSMAPVFKTHQGIYFGMQVYGIGSAGFGGKLGLQGMSLNIGIFTHADDPATTVIDYSCEILPSGHLPLIINHHVVHIGHIAKWAIYLLFTVPLVLVK